MASALAANMWFSYEGWKSRYYEEINPDNSYHKLSKELVVEDLNFPGMFGIRTFQVVINIPDSETEEGYIENIKKQFDPQVEDTEFYKNINEHMVRSLHCFNNSTLTFGDVRKSWYVYSGSARKLSDDLIRIEEAVTELLLSTKEKLYQDLHIA